MRRNNRLGPPSRVQTYLTADDAQNPQQPNQPAQVQPGVNANPQVQQDPQPQQVLVPPLGNIARVHPQPAPAPNQAVVGAIRARVEARRAAREIAQPHRAAPAVGLFNGPMTRGRRIVHGAYKGSVSRLGAAGLTELGHRYLHEEALKQPYHSKKDALALFDIIFPDFSEQQIRQILQIEPDEDLSQHHNLQRAALSVVLDADFLPGMPAMEACLLGLVEKLTVHAPDQAQTMQRTGLLIERFLATSAGAAFRAAWVDKAANPGHSFLLLREMFIDFFSQLMAVRGTAMVMDGQYQVDMFDNGYWIEPMKLESLSPMQESSAAEEDTKSKATGWKMHISLQEDELNMATAWNLVIKRAHQYGVPMLKMLTNGRSLSASGHSQQQGKQMTVYFGSTALVHEHQAAIQAFINAVEHDLREANVQSNDTSPFDEKLQGSRYCSYRNDMDAAGQYVAAPEDLEAFRAQVAEDKLPSNATPHNPGAVEDPFADYVVEPAVDESHFFHAEAEGAVPARSMAAGSTGGL